MRCLLLDYSFSDFQWMRVQTLPKKLTRLTLITAIQVLGHMGQGKVVNGDGCLTTVPRLHRQNSACAHNRGKNCDGVKWIIFGTVPVGFWSSHLSVLYPPQVIFSDAPSFDMYDQRLIFYLFTFGMRTHPSWSLDFSPAWHGKNLFILA